jgi:predicted dehydrogenase
MSKQLRVAIIGYKFMGKAHSNAWLQAGRFFNIESQPVLKVACGRDQQSLQDFAERWGWEHTETDWHKVIDREDIDVVDISLPQQLHCEVAIAAAKAGKHIFCEKPLALTVAEAQEMVDAVQQAGVKHYLNHNYRRCPAVQLAKRLIDEDKIGRIFHWRGAYQQDWIVDPNFPLTWHLQKEIAGSGPHGDLNSHSVDLAHYLVGDIATVACLTANFVHSRPLPSKGAGTFDAGVSANSKEMGKVTVEDASLMNVEFTSGAIGSFEATRFASGRKNRNTFEIYGNNGALSFDLERMNELQYHSRFEPEYAQGFRKILVTDPSHAYVGNWWPPGHIIGYEHSFVHAVVDFIHAIEKGSPIEPNFLDGLKCLKVLEAGLQSAASGKRVSMMA